MLLELHGKTCFSSDAGLLVAKSKVWHKTSLQYFDNMKNSHDHMIFSSKKEASI